MYKVKVIKMLLKDGSTADFGQEVNENQLTDLKDLLERDYISLVKASVENLEVKDTKVVDAKATETEVKESKNGK